MEVQLVGLDGSVIHRDTWPGDVRAAVLFGTVRKVGGDCRLFQGAREIWPWEVLKSLEAEQPIQVVRTLRCRNRASQSGGFAALRQDGSWLVWGSGNAPAGLSCDHLDGAQGLGENAAINSDGVVTTWDKRDCPGEALHSQLDVHCVYTNEHAYAAVSADRRVVLWGSNEPELLGGRVASFIANACGAAALMEDGSVATCNSGPASRRATEVPRALLRSDVVQLEANSMAFAAVKKDGSVVTWGVGPFGGTAPGALLSAQVVRVLSSDTAFAALKADGSVVVWGDKEAGGGGDASGVASLLSSDVIEIVATRAGFAALKADGSVICWVGSSPAEQMASQCLSLCATYLGAFAALRRDGSVTTWGRADAGGDSSAVATELMQGVVSVRANAAAFAALKKNGVVVTWGAADAGGDATPSGPSPVGVVAIFS